MRVKVQIPVLTRTNIFWFRGPSFKDLKNHLRPAHQIQTSTLKRCPFATLTFLTPHTACASTSTINDLPFSVYHIHRLLHPPSPSNLTPSDFHLIWRLESLGEKNHWKERNNGRKVIGRKDSLGGASLERKSHWEERH